MSTESIGANKRIAFLEYIRAFACICVILIHSSARFANCTSCELGSVDFWIGSVIDAVAHVGVPLFVMISGTLMLNEQYDYSISKNKIHILRMIKFYFFWSFIYGIYFYVIEKIIKGLPVSIISVVSAIIKGNYHLWFIPMIIGIYLILPILRLWVNEKNRKYVEYFLVLSFVFNFILPQAQDILISINSDFSRLVYVIDNFNLQYVMGYTSFFLLGWYVSNYGIQNNWFCLIIGIIVQLTMVILTYFLSLNGNYLCLFGDLGVGTLILSVSIFSIIRKKVNVNGKIPDSVLVISNHSLGVYAIHAGLITIIYSYLSVINTYFVGIRIILVGFSAFIVSLAIAIIMKKSLVFRNMV